MGLGVRSITAAGCLFATVQFASAADFPVKAPALQPAPLSVYSWTGLYIGGHLGYGWSHTDTTFVNGNPPFPAGTQRSGSQDGVLGGVQVGYNWQFAPNWLVGVQGDFSWSDINGSGTFNSTVPRFVGLRRTETHTNIPMIATATARLGYAVNNWLIYAKGGAAWARKEDSSRSVNPAAGNQLRSTTNDTFTRTGWTVGGGIEWAFAPNWSALVEYDYLDFGSETEAHNPTYFNGGNGLSPLLRDVDWHIHVVKVGVNYRFNLQ